MKKLYVISYTWLDIPDAQKYQGYYISELEAREAMDKMLHEEKECAQAFDQKAIGQFFISLDCYVLAETLLQQTV